MEPALPVSSPATFSREVGAERRAVLPRSEFRRYLGTPQDGVFKIPQFVSQTRLVFEDEKKLLQYGLDHFKGGILFAYFSVVDEGSHMLWSRYELELLNFYRAVDGVDR